MVILVDVSGSMKGLRLTIARQTVSSILDTLGDDDFFNIIAVSPSLSNHSDVIISFVFSPTPKRLCHQNYPADLEVLSITLFWYKINRIPETLCDGAKG